MNDLRETRKAAGLSQIQLAMRARVSRFRLSLAESGAIELRSDELTAISKAMRSDLEHAARVASAVLNAHEESLTEYLTIERETTMATGVQGANNSQMRPTSALSLSLRDKLQDIFTHHPPTDDQPRRYEAIRNKALELAIVILDNSPASADQTAAIRHLREAVMTANAAISLKGLV